jgi:predicted nucleic acid-binding protein
VAELAIVDTSALLASLDRRDRAHVKTKAVLQRNDLNIVVPGLVVSEVTYHLVRRFGPLAEARFVEGLADLRIEMPADDEWLRIAELVARYRDFPLGTTDASIVVLAEQLRTDLIITLDRRHFMAVRPRHVEAFRILPE